MLILEIAIGIVLGGLALIFVLANLQVIIEVVLLLTFFAVLGGLGLLCTYKPDTATDTAKLIGVTIGAVWIAAWGVKGLILALQMLFNADPWRHFESLCKFVKWLGG